MFLLSYLRKKMNINFSYSAIILKYKVFLNVSKALLIKITKAMLVFS